MSTYYELLPADAYGVPITTGYRTIRADNATAKILGSEIGRLAAGTKGKADPAKTYKYTASVPNGTGGFYALAGDIWHNIYDNNGTSINGWVAEIHLGKRYLNVTTINPTPPPAGPAISVIVDVQGYIPMTFTGTLTPE